MKPFEEIEKKIYNCTCLLLYKIAIKHAITQRSSVDIVIKHGMKDNGSIPRRDNIFSIPEFPWRRKQSPL
jgi:hypothetical protein